MYYFDYQKVAQDAGITPDALEELRRVIRREFPHDDMLYELHLLRACRAMRDGHLKLEEALRSEQPTGV